MLRRKFLLFGLLALITGGCFRACNLLTNNVVCVGDSVTVGLDTTSRYVDQLGYMNHKLDFKTVAKEGGQSSDGVLWMPEIIAERPHTVIIMFGLNDMKVSRTVFRNNLIALVTECQAMDYRVILCTPSPHMKLHAKLGTYATTIRNVSAYLHTDLADVYDVFPADWALMSTVNHPNARGHEIIANIIDRELNR